MIYPPAAEGGPVRRRDVMLGETGMLTPVAWSAQ